jgi:hypothetical protein
MKADPQQNRNAQNILVIACVVAVGVIIYWATRTSKPAVESPNPALAPQPAPTVATQNPSAVPPYYESAEAAKPYPALLPAVYFRRSPLVERAYRVAAELPGVLAQQPCYCYCDKFGHHSLLDCYASNHAAG